METRVSYPALRSRCFFFSSRRRHTRWPRDWSSDVCSSDLGVPREQDHASAAKQRNQEGAAAVRSYRTMRYGVATDFLTSSSVHRNLSCAREPFRSEEHTSELQSRGHLVCRLPLEKKNLQQT